MIRVAICEDNKQQRIRLAKLIAEQCKYYEPDIECFPGGSELIMQIEQSEYRPEIVFMDIVMPDKDGISVAKQINGLCPNCAIIYISAFIGYAMDVYETKHSYYILKSELEERLMPAVKKALEEIKHQPRISFKEGGTLRSIPMQNVFYMERRLKKTIIVCRDAHEYYCQEKAEEILERTGVDCFAQCHRSFFINMELAEAFRTDCFIFPGGLRVPVSRSYKNSVRETFGNYLAGKLE